LAVDGKDQVVFNLGACGPNGLYKLLQVQPIKVQKLFPLAGFESLQFVPDSSKDFYTTSFSKIEKLDLDEPNSSATAAPVFSMFGGHARLLDTLFVDQDHLLATLIVNRVAPADGAETKRLPPEFMAVAFDRKLKGYYVLDIKAWGPMAIRPTDQALFRFDADAEEIRQFTLPFLESGDSAALATASQAVRDAASNITPPGLDAGAILAQARDAYAELTSYSDSGTMATRMGSFSQDGTFTIRMQRPSFYRIAWTGLGSGGMAWCDGTGDYLRFAGRADEKQKDRETVLAGATGISGNAASTIPASFFHEQWGAVLNSIGDCHVLPDEPVDSIACSVVISVIHRKGGAEAALERAKRLLLRRLDKSQGEEELKVLLTEVLLESGTYLIPLLHACRRGSLLLA
jgi:hypothetical protein